MNEGEKEWMLLPHSAKALRFHRCLTHQRAQDLFFDFKART